MSRRIAAQMAAHQSWARTPNRLARVTPALRAGPQNVEWHLDRLHPSMADAPAAERLAAAESARKAYFARLAMKSAQARKRGAA